MKRRKSRFLFEGGEASASAPQKHVRHKIGRPTDTPMPRSENNSQHSVYVGSNSDSNDSFHKRVYDEMRDLYNSLTKSLRSSYSNGVSDASNRVNKIKETFRNRHDWTPDERDMFNKMRQAYSDWLDARYGNRRTHVNPMEKEVQTPNHGFGIKLQPEEQPKPKPAWAPEEPMMVPNKKYTSKDYFNFIDNELTEKLYGYMEQLSKPQAEGQVQRIATEINKLVDKLHVYQMGLYNPLTPEEKEQEADTLGILSDIRKMMKKYYKIKIESKKNRKVNLSESQLYHVILESAKRLIREYEADDYDEFSNPWDMKKHDWKLKEPNSYNARRVANGIFNNHDDSGKLAMDALSSIQRSPANVPPVVGLDCDDHFFRNGTLRR